MAILKFLFILKLLLIYQCNGECQEITSTLSNLLQNFCCKKPVFVSSDIYFGLILASGFLNDSVNNIRSTMTAETHRKRVKAKVLNILESSIMEDFKSLPVYKKIILENMKTYDWNLEQQIRHGYLLKPKHQFQWSNYTRIVNNGSPSRNLSDICLAQILSSNSPVFSAECSNIFNESFQSYGYHKTHQLLIALYIKHIKLIDWIPLTSTIQIILTKLCSEIYEESFQIIQNNIPTDYRDLLMEQVVLCTAAGFSELLDLEVITNILQWQKSNACFSTNTEVKTENHLKYECLNHMTGLGIAFLTILFKVGI